MEPIGVGVIGAVLGYLSGHLHAKISGSSCLYGCCKFDELDTDFSIIPPVAEHEPKGLKDEIHEPKNNNK